MENRISDRKEIREMDATELGALLVSFYRKMASGLIESKEIDMMQLARLQFEQVTGRKAPRYTEWDGQDI